MADLSQLIDPDELERVVRERYAQAAAEHGAAPLPPPVDEPPPEAAPEPEPLPPIDMASRLAEVEAAPPAPTEQLLPPPSALERGQGVMGAPPELETGMPGSLRSNRTRAVLSQLNESLLGGENYYEKNRARNERLQDRQFAADLQTHGQKGRLLPLIQQDVAGENARLSAAQKAQLEAEIRNQPISPELVKELGFPATIKTMGEAERFAKAGGTRMAQTRLQEEFAERQRQWMSGEKALDRASREKNARVVAAARRERPIAGAVAPGTSTSDLVSLRQEAEDDPYGDAAQRYRELIYGSALKMPDQKSALDSLERRRGEIEAQKNRAAADLRKTSAVRASLKPLTQFSPDEIRAWTDVAKKGEAARAAATGVPAQVDQAWQNFSGAYTTYISGAAVNAADAQRILGKEVASLLDIGGNTDVSVDGIVDAFKSRIMKAQIAPEKVPLVINGIRNLIDEVDLSAVRGMHPRVLERAPLGVQNVYTVDLAKSADVRAPKGTKRMSGRIVDGVPTLTFYGADGSVIGTEAVR